MIEKIEKKNKCLLEYPNYMFILMSEKLYNVYKLKKYMYMFNE